MVKTKNQEETGKFATTYFYKKYGVKKNRNKEKTLLNLIFRGPNTPKEKKNVYALSVI